MPSATYRVPKVRPASTGALLTTAAAFLVLLVVGVLVSTALAIRASRAELATRRTLEKMRDEQRKTEAALEQVRNEQGKTEAALTRATAEEQRAVQSAAQSRGGVGFLPGERAGGGPPRNGL